ncbi:MAG: aromatic ring-hydroxylating dioxygenase subunit alpha [Actinobacteria bacterium]|nr:aromatic ring-hydroxylating dioxygenase subunit alpha [Actinomycetota bacterium]
MSETLPWGWYSDSERLERERSAIFARGWQYAGHTGQVEHAGDRFAARAGHVPVAVVRDQDGELLAFLNVCRHRGAEVVRESGNRNTLQCHYHAWTYGLDGSLIAAPRSEREPGFDPAGLSLVPLRLETLGPLIFVNPEPEGPPLAEVASGIPEALAAGGIDLDALAFDRRIDYGLEANWKVVIENYLECYHCPTAHPDFSRAVDVHPDRYELETADWSSSQHARARNGDGSCQFHFLWPNTRINVFPGGPNLSIGPAVPSGPDRTEGFFDYFFGSEVPAEEREELIAFDAQVGAEDRELVESVQRGMRSGLVEHGRLLPASERLIAHFQSLVRDAYSA